MHKILCSSRSDWNLFIDNFSRSSNRKYSTIKWYIRPHQKFMENCRWRSLRCTAWGKRNVMLFDFQFILILSVSHICSFFSLFWNYFWNFHRNCQSSCRSRPKVRSKNCLFFRKNTPTFETPIVSGIGIWSRHFDRHR